MSGTAVLGGIYGEWPLRSTEADYAVESSRSLLFDWRGRRAWRWLSAQSGQRVCPGMAGCRQSLQSPESFSLLRASTARALARSCRSSGVRRTRFGVMVVLAVLAAGLLLATSGRDLGASLVAFLLWRRVLPALADWGRGKVNWKVPPIARVCGAKLRLGFEGTGSGIPAMFAVPAMSCSFFSALQSRFWWMSGCRLDVELQRVRFVTGVNDLSGRFLVSDDF